MSALETQIKNIESKTGKSLKQLTAIIKRSGLAKHGELRQFAMSELTLGYGDANTLVHVALASVGDGAAKAKGATTHVVDELYSGAKASLRPIHEALMKRIESFGPFEIAPKKAYLSLRRKKQFAMIGPATNTRVEVGLNATGLEGTERLAVMPPGGMCKYKIKLTGVKEVDAELIAWIRKAYEQSGAP
jgi:hypothetical protein